MYKLLKLTFSAPLAGNIIIASMLAEREIFSSQAMQPLARDGLVQVVLDVAYQANMAHSLSFGSLDVGAQLLPRYSCTSCDSHTFCV